MKTVYGALGLIGDRAIKCDFGMSGNPATFTMNDTLTYACLLSYLKMCDRIGGDYDEDAHIDIETMIRAGESVGIKLTVERVVLLPDIGEDLVQVGEEIDIDLLGCKAVASNTPGQYGNLIIPCLQETRAMKMLMFDKTATVS